MPRAADLDWRDLRFFLAAMRAGSLAGAARLLGVEHSTVGRRLSALEHALGAPLVRRGPDGLQLTDLGKKLAPAVERMERAVVTIQDLSQSQKTSVRLAVPSGFTEIFATALKQPRRKPLPFSLAILTGARPVDLMRGEADLAIRAGSIAHQDLVAAKLCQSGFSLYGSDAYFARRPSAVDPDDLRGHDVIGYDGSLSTTPPAKWLEKHGARAEIVLRSREMIDVLSAARSGIGLAVLPCLLGDREPALRRLTPKVLTTQDLSLVYRREARLSEAVRAAIRFVRAVMQQHAAVIRGVEG